MWYKIKSSLLSFFSDIRIYPGGIIIAGDSYYKLKGDETRQILNILKPGDVMLRRYSHYLGSVLIKGYFSHAAIYVGDDQVIHMLGSGINKEDILTFLRCDDICILRSINKDITDFAVSKAYKFLAGGIEYDYDFDDKKPDKFYCTEFVDNIFNYPVKNTVSKNNVILPDDFLKCKYFETVWKR